MDLLIFRPLISLMLLMYTRVLKIQAFSYLISLDSPKLVSMVFAVKPADFFLEVQIFSVGDGVCREGKKIINYFLCYFIFTDQSVPI